jgi:hypothetical protein
MGWYDANEYKPVYGKWIFIWDKVNQNEILVNMWDDANWGKVGYTNFPIWKYAQDGHVPIPIHKELRD